LTASGTNYDVLNLADSGFPTGGYGHSAGLEYAVQAGWVADRTTFEAWCTRAVAGSLVPLDLRAALKAWYGPTEAWADLDARMASFRTSRVQREASAQVGRSFLKSVASCYGERAQGLPEADHVDAVQFPVAWGAAFRVLGLPSSALAETLVFGALRQWTQVAIRIVPLGQKDAFAALTAVLANLPEWDPEAEAERPLESFSPGLELAGLGMGTLERKYFRS